MGLLDAVGRGLSAAGYGAGEMFAKGALIDTQNEAETQRQLRLAEFKATEAQRMLAAKAAQQQAILGGSAPAGGLMMTEGENGETGAISVDQKRIAQLSKEFKIPEAAIRHDLAYNGGKGISKMLYESGKPNVQIHGGVAHDMKNLEPGVVPSVSTSTTGQTTAIERGPDGKPRVVVPEGAAAAAALYKGIEAGSKSASTLTKVYNPETGREEWKTEAEVINASRPGAAAAPAGGRPAGPEAALRTQMTGGMGGDPAAAKREIEQSRASLVNVKDEGSRQLLTAHIADMERQLANMGAGPGAPAAAPRAGGPLAAGPSAAEKSAQDARAASEKTNAEQIAKDVAEQRKTIIMADAQAPGMIARYQQIGKLLANVDGGVLTPGGVRLASAMNSVGIKIDKNLADKEAAAALGNELALQLRNPSGGAGMPGAMSDADRNFLASMTPNIAQSAAGRKQLIDARIAIEERNRQVATFVRRYEKKYGRLDNDFFEQLSSWSQSTPLFGSK
jgi:hypothetical protein